MNALPYVSTLTQLCNLPTAPYAEQHVIAHLLAWAAVRSPHIRVARDPAGNVYLHYLRGRTTPPLVIEAHMDHPGFMARETLPDGRLVAQFLGGVKPSHFGGATAAFWLNDPPAIGSIKHIPAKGRWVPLKVLEATAVDAPVETPPKNYIQAIFEPPPIPIPRGSIGMWNLPDAAILPDGVTFAARVCDDIAGVAAILCLLDELIAQNMEAHVIGLCTRAEEVGFAGVIAVAQNGWIPKDSRVIGLETSKGSAFAPQGAGPIIRVGDRQGTFSPGLTHFICQSAGMLSDADSTFKWQRKLMDGGTCNSTAFVAFGYDAAGMCVALGNYHNMSIEGDTGHGQGPKAGPGIASETIHLDDFSGMVKILIETARRLPNYQPGFRMMRDRLAKLHADEQRELLYGTSDQQAASGL